MAIAGALFLGACAPPAPAVPENENLDFRGPNATPATIYNGCASAAYRRCGYGGKYCDAYVKSFTRTCMVQNGVAADYIFLLTQ